MDSAPQAPQPPEFEPTRVADVVLESFPRFLRLLKPLTLLTLPAVLFGMVAIGMFMLMLIQMGLLHRGTGGFDSWQSSLFLIQGGFLMIGAAFFMCYMTFPIMRYIRDDYMGQVEPGLMHYWFPNKTLLGLIGLSMLFIGILVPLIPLMVIGFILLLVPGFALCMAFGVLTQLIPHQYMLRPEDGIFEAVKRVALWFKTDWIRVLGFGLLLWIVQCLVSIPGGILRAFIDIGSELQWTPPPNILMMLGILAIPVVGVLIWMQMVLTYGLTNVIVFRFLFDLEARDRLAALEPETIAPPEGEAASDAWD